MKHGKLKPSDTVVQDIWGEAQEKKPILRERFCEPPFTIFDTKSATWQRRRKFLRDFLKVNYDSEGIQAKEMDSKSDCGFGDLTKGYTIAKIASEAVYDPRLLEVMFDLFCPEGGSILDPFNGSHISGCLAHELGYKFTGIDVRQNIIEQNHKKRIEIFGEQDVNIKWIVGDSDKVLDTLLFEEYDMINSCHPYADLVKYSKDNPLEGDLSLLNYDDFIPKFQSIAKKSCALLKPGGYAVITIGEVRDRKTGELYNLVFDTVEIFRKAGMIYYNSAILLNSLGTAPLRAKGHFERGDGKLVSVHQNILVFKKPKAI